MSRDIRSFFTVKNSKTGSNNSSSKLESIKKPSLKKRSIVISDSDSDEESNKNSIKRSKISEKKQISTKKADNLETKSKYFEKHDVSVEDIFGEEPVKRDNSRKIVKKPISKEEKEFHLDKEFEEELLKLDENDLGIPSKSYRKDEQVVQNGVIESPNKKEIARAENNNIVSSLKKQSDVSFNESPRKRLKLEIKQNSSDLEENPCLPHKDSSPIKVKELESQSPIKVSSTQDSSPSKTSAKISAVKISPVKKSPHKDRPSKSSPDKSFTNKLSLNRIKKDVVKNDKHKGSTDETPPHVNTNDVSKCESKNKEKYIIAMQISTPIVNESFSQKKIKTEVEMQDKSKINDVTSDSFTPCNLWVEKYKPMTTKQIIGQQGEKSCVNKLINWLKNWEMNHSGNKKLVKPSPWAKNDDGAYFKAALLSGPPGVGKTTTAHLVCKELGFDVVEFNASDTRSKKLLHEEVSELLSTKSLSPFFTGKGDQVTKKHVLLMDEVDGMAGNEDRGGVQELISLIKQSRIPVICMCNDRNHPKIRSLANYCFDLRFSKPRVEQIRGAMMSMCFKENLKVKPDQLTEIITSANQDIRLIVNHLSMLAMQNTSLTNSTKHIKLGPWDIVRKIFSEEEHKSMTIHDKCDLFFHDYSATPLFVQENYLNAVPHKPEAKNKIKKMELFAKAAQSLSLGDLTEKSIRSNNAWSLLPVQAIFSSLVPGDVLEGHLGAQINFPAWFGKNSRQTKMNRLVQELTIHSRLKISGNREAMNLDYLAPLQSSILTPLLHDGVEGVPQALSALSEYCLIREDLESIAELCSWPNTKNLFSEVDSKVKAAFTRAYNKTSVPTPYATVPVKKGSRAEVDITDDIGEEEDGIGTQEDEEEEGLEEDAMIMVKKKPASRKTDKESQPSTSRASS